MQFFKLDGTIYKITLNKGTSWRDTGADTVQRWNPEQEAWLESDISASRVRSFGEPAQNPNPDRPFTADEILAHEGPVEVFCPAVDPNRSTYRKIPHVAHFVEKVFDDPKGFRPRGRVEGSRMLVCMLPQ
jgi:hypothetical protein